MKGRTFRTCLVTRVGFWVGGVCVVCTLVGGNVPPEADSCTLTTSPGIYFTSDDSAAIKPRLFP